MKSLFIALGLTGLMISVLLIRASSTGPLALDDWEEEDDLLD